MASHMRFLVPIPPVITLRHLDVGYLCRLGNARLENHGIVCIIGLVCVRHGVHRTVVSGAVLLFVCQPPRFVAGRTSYVSLKAKDVVFEELRLMPMI